jgi:hypothetical protein
MSSSEHLLAAIRRPATVGILLLVGACAAVPPTVTTALIGFGRDVILSAAQNFAPQYAQSTGNVLLALAETATGQPFMQLQSGDIVQANDAWAYDEDGNDDRYGEVDNARPTAAGHWNDGAFDAGWGETGRPTADTRLMLDVAVLVQRRGADGRVTLEQVEDGAVLYGENTRGSTADRVKFFFRSNCECYVYIVGIDSTAWMTHIHPRSFGEFTRVQAGRDHLVPEGNLWWTLDEHKGIETIYFVLSRSRIPDLEDRLAALPLRRPTVSPEYRPVTVPVVLSSRGLVLVEDSAPIQVPAQYQTGQAITPFGFTTQGTENRLVVTRWFAHE